MVDQKSIYWPTTTRDEYGCSHLDETAVIDILFTSDYSNDGNNMLINVSHYNQWNLNSTASIAFGLGNQGINFSNYTPQNNIVINNKTYNNVYVITFDTSKWTNLSDGLWRLYYTKQNGILEWDLTQGISWVRIN